VTAGRRWVVGLWLYEVVSHRINLRRALWLRVVMRKRDGTCKWWLGGPWGHEAVNVNVKVRVKVRRAVQWLLLRISLAS
jgi:hypothetical protein